MKAKRTIVMQEKSQSENQNKQMEYQDNPYMWKCFPLQQDQFQCIILAENEPVCLSYFSFLLANPCQLCNAHDCSICKTDSTKDFVPINTTFVYHYQKCTDQMFDMNLSAQCIQTNVHSIFWGSYAGIPVAELIKANFVVIEDYKNFELYSKYFEGFQAVPKNFFEKRIMILQNNIGSTTQNSMDKDELKTYL